MQKTATRSDYVDQDVFQQEITVNTQQKKETNFEALLQALGMPPEPFKEAGFDNVVAPDPVRDSTMSVFSSDDVDQDEFLAVASRDTEMFTDWASSSIGRIY